MDDAAVVADNLGKVFYDSRRGEVQAVDGVSFRCAAGRVFGLLGTNGAGKTTTLRMLATVLRPTSGSAAIAGHDVVREPEAVRRRIGYMSSDTGVYSRMTAQEMVDYFGRLYGMDEAHLTARRESLFALLEMNAFRHVLGAKMSTGMKQKVSLARTIIHDPPILIFDEPTAGLDIIVARSVLDFIRRCRDDGKCVIFSTHVMREAEKLCDRIAIIHEGRILAEGAHQDLLDRTGQPDLEEAFFSLVGPKGPAAETVGSPPESHA
jgi:sodium transport system ATP-binding protein